MNENLDREWRFWVVVAIIAPFIVAATIADWVRLHKSPANLRNDSERNER